MKRPALVLLALVALCAAPAAGQGRAGEIFRSSQAATLPTAETLARGRFLFEISHRFRPAVSDGADGLWGLDGPVYNRLGLSYGLTDRAVLGILRTNLDDNVELNVKAGVLEGGSETMPVKLAVMGGVAWNTEPIEIEGAEDNEAQLYAQVVANALLGEKLAVGIVPTYLHNPRIRDVDADGAFVLGLHAQLYMTRSVSALAEWAISEARPEMEHDSGTFGIEIRTRGHFFKLVLTNQTRMNPTQYLGGAEVGFEPDEWRLGFNVQRLLIF